MSFEPVYTKTVVNVTLTTGGGIEVAPPSGFTWVIVNVDAVITTAGTAGNVAIDGDFQSFLYWSQPHGMLRHRHWTGRRAILENVLGTFTGDIGGQAVVSITVWELTLP